MICILAFLLCGFSGKKIPTEKGLYVIDAEIAAPVMVGNNKMKLIIRDPKSGKPLQQKLSIEVVTWMSVHEHGSRVAAVVSSEGNGRYLVDMVNFTMPGPWDVYIKITNANADGPEPEDAIISVEVLGAENKKMPMHGSM
jgi:hypothetical protein